MNSIREWLNGSQNYDVGVALFQCYGDNPDMTEMFLQGHSEYRQARLLSALEKLYASGDHIEIELPGQPEPVAVFTPPSPMPEASTKPKTDPYYANWNPIFKEMQHLRSQLRLIPTDEERGKVANRILDLEQECNYWWERRDYYLETGQHMPEDNRHRPDPHTNQNELQKRLLTVRTYVTRYEKKIEEQGNKPALVEKLNAYTAERDELEQKLGYERTPNKHSADPIESE